MNQSGMTLPELLTTMTVLAISISIAIPGSKNFIDKQRISAAHSQLFDAIQYARSQAISENKHITLCVKASDCLADNSQDARQLIVFEDINRNGILDKDEALHLSLSLYQGMTWQWKNFRKKAYLTFKPSGITDSLNGTFTLCRGSTSSGAIVINITGRVRKETQTNLEACST